MNTLFSKTFPNPENPGVTDVTAEDVQKLADQLHIIDVRRPDEFVGELGHIKGAKLITLDTLPQRVSEVPRSGTVVFVCRSGGRSGRAAAFVAESGLTNVFNMKGGMLRWNELRFSTEGKK